MTDTEKLQETATMLSTIKENIQTKYKSIMLKIQEINDEINNLEQKYVGNSQQFIDEKRKQLMKKLDTYKQKAQEFINEKTQQAQDWFDEQTATIKENMMIKLEAKIKALAGI